MRSAILTLAALGLIACPGSPPADAWRVASVSGPVLHLESAATARPGGTRQVVRLAGVRVPETGWPGASEAEAALETLVDGKELSWTVVEAAPGVGSARIRPDLVDLVADGVAVNEAIVLQGWARATDDHLAMKAAEAKAREEKVGGWADAHRETARHWLRGVALGFTLSGAEPDDPRTRLRIRWFAAQEAHREALAFWDLAFTDDDVGGLTCGQEVELAVAPTLTGDADATAAFTEGRTVARVSTLGPATCEDWQVVAGAIERREESDGETTHTQRRLRLRDGGATVDWLGASSETVGSGATSSTGGSDRGPVPVTAASEVAVLVGGELWFTSLAGCAAALEQAHPEGCADP